MCERHLDVAIMLAALLLAGTMCAPAVAANPAPAVPASLVACAADADPVRRLACFDREIKQFLTPTRSDVPVAEAPRPLPTTPNLSEERQPAASRKGLSPSAPATASDIRRIRARIEHLEFDSDNFLLLTLDNHQTWKQEREAPAELHFRAGDAVAIDRELGAYYLSDRLGTAVRVRRIEP